MIPLANKKALLQAMNNIAKKKDRKYCPHGWKTDCLEYCDECSKKVEE